MAYNFHFQSNFHLVSNQNYGSQPISDTVHDCFSFCHLCWRLSFITPGTHQHVALDDLALLDLSARALQLGDGVQVDGHPLVAVGVLVVELHGALHGGQAVLQVRQLLGVRGQPFVLLVQGPR